MKSINNYILKFSKIGILLLFIFCVVGLNSVKVESAVGLFASPRRTNEFINRNSFTETKDIYRGFYYPKKWTETNQYDTYGNLQYWISDEDKLYDHEDFVTPVFDSTTPLDLSTVGSKLSQNVYVSLQGFHSAFKNKITWVAHVKGRIPTNIDKVNYFLQFSLSKGLEFSENANPVQWHVFGQSNDNNLPNSMRTDYLKQYTTITNEETREAIEGQKYKIFRIATGASGDGVVDKNTDVYYIIETTVDPNVDVNKYELRVRATVASSEFFYANFQFLNDITQANNNSWTYGNINRKSHKSVLATATVSKNKIARENVPDLTPKEFEHKEVVDDKYSLQKDVVLNQQRPNDKISGVFNNDHSKITKESDYYLNYNNSLKLPVNILADEDVKSVKEYNDSYLSKRITPVNGNGENGEYYVDIRIQGKSYNTESYGGNYIFVLDSSASMSTARTSPGFGNIIRNPFGVVNGKEYSKGEIAGEGLKKAINSLMSNNNLQDPNDPKNNIVAVVSFSDQINYMVPATDKHIGNTLFTADKSEVLGYIQNLWTPWPLSRQYDDLYSPEKRNEYMVGGDTNYQGAVFAVNELLETLPKIDKTNKRKTHVIFLTDGEPTFSYKLERVFKDENGLYYGESTFERVDDTKVGVTFAKSLKSGFDGSNYAFYDKIKSANAQFRDGWGIEYLITGGGYEKINSWGAYSLRTADTRIWNPLNRYSSSFLPPKEGFVVNTQNGADRRYTPVLSPYYEFRYDLALVGRYVDPYSNGLNPYTGYDSFTEEKKYWNQAIIANRDTRDAVLDNGVGSKIEIIKLRNRYPDVDYKAIAIYSTKKVFGSQKLTEEKQREENARMEDVLSYFVDRDENFRLIRPENFDQPFIDTVNTYPYIKTIKNATFVDPMGTGIIFQNKFSMKKASNQDLTDGDYYIFSNKDKVLDGLNITFDNDTNTLKIIGNDDNSGINLGAYEYIKFRYKIKLDKTNSSVATGNFVQTNKQTILYNNNPNIKATGGNNELLPRYFPIPSARIEPPLAIEVIKKDTSNKLIPDNKMVGTKFKLMKKDQQGNFSEIATDTYSLEDNTIVFSGLDIGKEYYLEEVTSPTGYIKENRRKVFKIENNVGNTSTDKYILSEKFENDTKWNTSTLRSTTTGAYVIDVINKPVTIVINKVDKESKKSLKGAKFKLYRYTGSGISFPGDKPGKTLQGVLEAEWTQSDADIVNGGHNIEGLVDGFYYLVEEEAPEGYQKPATSFSLGMLYSPMLTSTDYKSVHYIENTVIKLEYPKAGGIGIYAFLICGLILMSVALYLQLRIRKNRKL